MAEPAFFAEDFGPALHVVAAQTQGVVHLVRNVGGQVGVNPGANVFAECLFFGGESEIHKMRVSVGFELLLHF